jgi:hypothetical protein
MQLVLQTEAWYDEGDGLCRMPGAALASWRGAGFMVSWLEPQRVMRGCVH